MCDDDGKANEQSSICSFKRKTHTNSFALSHPSCIFIYINQIQKEYEVEDERKL